MNTNALIIFNNSIQGDTLYFSPFLVTVVTLYPCHLPDPAAVFCDPSVNAGPVPAAAAISPTHHASKKHAAIALSGSHWTT